MNERIDNSASTGKTELELSKEKLFKNLVLIISGESGTGKSTLGKKISELLNIKSVDVGDQIRKKTEKQTGKAPVGFADRDLSVDIEFDKVTAEIIKNSINGEPIILVARMGPWVAKKEEVKAEETEQPFPRVVTVNLYASKETKIERIRIRERAKNPKITDEEIDQKTASGNIKNQKNWHEAHPDLVGDPLDPKAMYREKPIFNIIINTDGLNAEEVLLETIRLLKESNYLTKEENIVIENQLNFSPTH